MIVRHYSSQLAKMTAEGRRKLEECAVSQTENWIDVPGHCVEMAIPQPTIGRNGPTMTHGQSIGTPSPASNLVEIAAALELAKTVALPICNACQMLQGQTDNGWNVLCEEQPRRCHCKRGEVSLISGQCPLGKWNMRQALAAAKK